MRDQLSQPQDGSTTPQAVNETQLYLDAVGGEKKKRVYGIGSSNSSYYPSSSSSASSSAPHNAQLELQIKQLQDELHQMRQQHQEERSQMEQQQEEDRRAREQQQAEERTARQQQTRDEVTRLFNEQMQQWKRSNPSFGPGGDGSGVG